jgi:hypothetical protein
VSSLLNDRVLTFLRRAERFQLAELPDTVVAAAIKNPLVSTKKSIRQDALDTAVAAIHGYPFLIQVVGYELWQADPAARTIDLDMALTAIPRAMRTANRLVHEPVLNDLSERDRDFLLAMAEDECDPTTIADVARRMAVSADYANKYRARLIAAEVIEPMGRGRIRFTIPFLREYLRESRSR